MKSARLFIPLLLLSIILMGATQCKTFPELKDDISGLEGKLARSRKEVSRLKSAQSDLIREKSAVEGKFARLQKEHNAFEKKSLVTITGLKEKIIHLNALLEDRNKEIDILSAREKEERADNKRLQSLLTLREKKISSLEERLRFTQKERERLDNLSKENKSKISDLSKRLKLTLSSMRNLEDDLDKTRESLNKTSREKKSLSETSTAAGKRIKELIKETTALSREVAGLREKADLLPGFKENVKRFMDKNTALEKKVIQLENLADINSKKILVQQNELSSSKEDINALKKENLKLVDERNKTKAELAALEKSQASLDIENKKIIEERNRLRDTLDEREAKLKELRDYSQKQIEKLNRQNKEIQENFSKKIKETQVKLKEVEGKLVISFIDKILFDSGKAVIKDSAKKALHDVAEILKRYPDRHVIIEGHTDSEPILTYDFPSNWELSITRATRVLRYLVDKEDVPPSQVSAAGYGEYKPVATNQTDEGRSMNRRVEIVILPEKLKRKPVNKDAIPSSE